MSTALRLLLCVLLGGVALVATPASDAAAPVTVRGQVTDLGGVPLAGVTVAIIDWSYRGGAAIGRTVTDEAGRYRISYLVDEDTADHVSFESNEFGSPRDREISGLPGRTYTVDVALRRLPRITGHVVNTSGEPVSGLRVGLFNTAPGGDCPGGVHSAPDGSECSDWNIEHFIYTGAGGRFSATIRDGDLFSVVLRDEYLPEYETTAVHGVAAGEHIEVVVTPGGPEPEPVTVEGVVTDTSGHPVAGVEVVAVDPDGEREEAIGYSPRLASSVTDDAGSYELSFDPLALDNYEKRIHVRVESGAGVIAWPVGDAAYYEPGATIVTDIPLGPPGTVSGTVLDADGDPLPGAEVCCDIDGATTVADPAGDYSLTVQAGFGTLVADDSPLSRTDYVLDPGASIDVDVQFRLPPEVEPEPPAPEPDLTRPAPPQRLRVTVLGPHRVRVGFRRAYSGGLPITAFRAECAGTRVPTRSARGDGSPLAVSRLESDHGYRCRVRARNELGWGPSSAYSPRFRTPEA